MKVYCVFRYTRYSDERWEEKTVLKYITLSMEAAHEYVSKVLIPQQKHPDAYIFKEFDNPRKRVYSDGDWITQTFIIRETETDTPLNIG